MPDWVRVKSKDTGHVYSVQTVYPDEVEVLKGEPAVDDGGVPLPPVLNEKITTKKVKAMADSVYAPDPNQQ